MGLKEMFAARKALMAHSKGDTEGAYAQYTALYDAGNLTDATYLLP